MNLLNVKVAGEDVTCQMGILALRHYCEHHNIGLEALGTHMQRNGVFAVTDIIYFSHLAYCNLNGAGVKITRNQCTALVEEVDEAFFERVQEAILDIKLLGKTLREAEGDVKKNQAMKS